MKIDEFFFVGKQCFDEKFLICSSKIGKVCIIYQPLSREQGSCYSERYREACMNNAIKKPLNT